MMNRSTSTLTHYVPVADLIAIVEDYLWPSKASLSSVLKQVVTDLKAKYYLPEFTKWEPTVYLPFMEKMRRCLMGEGARVQYETPHVATRYTTNHDLWSSEVRSYAWSLDPVIQSLIIRCHRIWRASGRCSMSITYPHTTGDHLRLTFDDPNKHDIHSWHLYGWVTECTKLE